MKQCIPSSVFHALLYSHAYPTLQVDLLVYPIDLSNSIGNWTWKNWFLLFYFFFAMNSSAMYKLISLCAITGLVYNSGISLELYIICFEKKKAKPRLVKWATIQCVGRRKYTGKFVVVSARLQNNMSCLWMFIHLYKWWLGILLKA